MYKSSISFFFALLFTLFMFTPSIIYIIEKNSDATVVFTINDEENKENEAAKDLEIELLQISKNPNSIIAFQKESKLKFYLQNYSQLHLENNSPPPEQVKFT